MTRAAGDAHWAAAGTPLIAEIQSTRDAALNAYRANPKLVEEHAGLELDAGTGGYGRRQVFELIQNATDQLESEGGRVQLVLTQDGLYCANTGEPFTPAGLVSVLHAYVSDKDDESIGKFGLGFKSVLGVTNAPLVLSRTGSFRFGPDVATAITGVVPEAETVPVLRLADVVDPAEAFANDAVLAELAPWAATIVKLPFAGRPPDWLRNDLGDFPTQFLAFADHVETLVLDDRLDDGQLRHVTAEREGERVVVVEAEEEREWLVFSEEVPLDKAAKSKAGKLADRDKVTVKWAVPASGRSGTGGFWSYFPTLDLTTLRGALNAPWQLSPDRLHLISDSAYNMALLKGAARLVATAAEQLHSLLRDPAQFLELMPARGREARSWGDGVLTEETNDLLSAYPAVPMLSGELGLAIEARLFPEELPEKALEIWAGAVDPGDWVHPAVDLQKDRRARVRSYMKDPDGSTAQFSDWFMAILAEPSAEVSAQAIAVAAALCETPWFEQVRQLPFILTDDDELVAPSDPHLVLPGEFAVPTNGVQTVNGALLAQREARDTLTRLGIKTISADVELQRLVGMETGPDYDWEHFWTIVRQVPESRVVDIITAATGFDPRVRVLTENYRRPTACLLPGVCVPHDGSRDAGVTVDIKWHSSEISLLQKLGCVQGPSASGGSRAEPWFGDFVDEGIDRFMEQNRPSSPARSSVTVEHEPFPGPMTVMRALSDEGKAEFSKHAFANATSLGRWEFQHSTLRDKYRPARLPNPAVWLTLEEGMLPTPLGPLPPGRCVAPSLRVGGIVPAAECSEAAADAFGLPSGWDEADDVILKGVLETALEADPEVAARLYSNLAGTIPAPEVLRCVRGGEASAAAPEKVAACADDNQWELLRSGPSPILFVPEESEKHALISAWGLADAADLVSRRLAFADQTSPLQVIDLYPPLAKKLPEADRELRLVRCSEIRLIEETLGGTRSTEKRIEREGDTVYCVDFLDERSLLLELSRLLGLGLSRENVEHVLKKVEDKKVKDLRKQVRHAESNATKLKLLVGASNLSRQLPSAALSTYAAFQGEPTHEKLAELALNVHGIDVLRRYREEIAETGIEPPHQWAGTRPAREFVRSLGFPDAYAGFPGGERDPELVIEGRPDMPGLHQYQVLIAQSLQELLGKSVENRAMLSLPTGSGKTRVAIEGTIQAIESGAVDPQIILWVAQTDELCEQAVQAWAELWRARGLEEQLTISRLWSSNEAEPTPEGIQVVIATIAKLGVIDKERYEWLSDPGAVFIDEAHAATSPSYGELLRWLDLSRGKFGPPLVGLTATPYKGNNEELTKRLANMFGRQRLDVVAFGEGDHHARLQELGVISRVRHEVLEGGEIELTAKEAESMITPTWLPKSAETRLGEEVERTKRIISSIEALPDDWPILVFAPSVENAQALAGLLSDRGVPSAPIYGEMPKSARRWYVTEFRAGRLRVLTNYNVLAEGFDAPAVRAVYVARPVYAPNLYQQMVGRGLRGKLNGGKPECLIVDVADNVVNFDRELAFRGLDYLWSPSEAAAAVPA